MLQIEIIEEYEKQCMKLATVIAQLTTISYQEDYVINWLEELESLAVQGNDKIVADIALTKGKILTYIPKMNEVATSTSGNKRKLKKQYIVMCLEELKCCIDEYLHQSRTLIEETKVLCNKLAAVALQKGYMKSASTTVQEVVTLVKQDEELLPAWVNAVGTVGMNNAIVILGRALQMVRELS